MHALTGVWKCSPAGPRRYTYVPTDIEFMGGVAAVVVVLVLPTAAVALTALEAAAHALPLLPSVAESAGTALDGATATVKDADAPAAPEGTPTERGTPANATRPPAAGTGAGGNTHVELSSSGALGS